ncbi:hypothetical protein DFO77_12474 [Marinilabilia salmonicolor]|uniref:Uncharacterized protein n=1 Tax=Marinilabilia salmonicolor TaxID=989 RepID=A0A368UMR3_9BACT|nr:hypothetical protein DFO77_12474 [Marinilabilia salmonicolor]
MLKVCKFINFIRGNRPETGKVFDCLEIGGGMMVKGVSEVENENQLQ